MTSTENKPKKCLVLFCNNPVCAECEEGELCAIHRCEQKVFGKVQRDYTKRLRDAK